MNLIVLLRPVRDPAGFTVNRKAQKIFVKRDGFIINPSDRNALEAALQLGGPVTAVAVGAAPAQDALRLALATGAARAVQLAHPALEHADAFVLAAVFQRLVTRLGGADLLLLGADVLDADTAQVGPRLAAALDWPFIANAHRLEMNGAELTAVAAVQRGFRKFRAPTPAVVAVARDSNKPRYAPGARLITAYQSQDAVETFPITDLGLAESDLAPVTERRGESFPPERELGNHSEGGLPDVARQVAAEIRRA